MKFQVAMIAAIASIVLFAGCVPDEPDEPGIIEISSFEGLCKIGKTASHPLDGNYALTCNIDASASRTMNSEPGFPQGFEPIGPDFYPNTRFRGSFDGGGYTISGLFIYRPNSDYIGLFGYVNSSAKISNLRLAEVSVTGRSDVGGLAGLNSGMISQSCVSGTVASDRGSSSTAAGGLVGSNLGTVTQCYSTARVDGGYAGGLVSRNSSGGVISQCYASGTVTGSGMDNGGLAGTSLGRITDSYSVGRVVGELGAGGLVGYILAASGTTPAITNCYAAGYVTVSSQYMQSYGGGLLGNIAPSGTTFTKSLYWDTQTSGWASSKIGVGRTTEQMRQQSTFVDWDFTSVWATPANGYPYLRALGPTVMP